MDVGPEKMPPTQKPRTPQSDAGKPVGGASFRVSFRAAFSGLCRTIASQRNMKLHVLSALMVMIVGMSLPFNISERASLLFAVALVWFAEILNTGLEAMVDLYISDYHRLAMVAKDAAAAGVLVLSIASALIFADVILHRIGMILDMGEVVLRSVLIGVPLVLLEAIGLFWQRRGVMGTLRLSASMGLVVFLSYFSTDFVFSLVAALIVLTSAYARWYFPDCTGRGAPRRAV